MTDLDRMGRLLTDREADARRASVELSYAERDREASAGKLADAVDALSAASEVAEALQREAHAGVAAVVTRCLAGVFDEDYTFKLIFERSAGRTRCRCVFVQDEEEVDPQGCAPGGAVDVAAFALRLACLVLSDPQPRKLLVLDEPLQRINGKAFRLRMRDLLEQLAEELGVQVVMATGLTEYMTGNVIEL